MILVVSYPDEEHTESVVARLGHAGREVVRLDLSELPASAAIDFRWQDSKLPAFNISRGGRCEALERARVGWWRRVRGHVVAPGLSAEMRAFAESETAQSIGGMLDSLSCRWVNPRAADEAAHRKPYQWTVAQRVGLTVPNTLVTTDPEAARRFLDEAAPGRVVFKPFLASTIRSWRETRILGPEDRERLALLRYAPVIFQHYIEGVDLRITVVGNEVFAAEIDARATQYPFDMRMVIGEARVSAVTLPDTVRGQLLALQQALQLEYGAIDMRRTDAGEYFFFEVNPAGQWLFVEERTGLPISQAMAELLMRLEAA